MIGERLVVQASYTQSVAHLLYDVIVNVTNICHVIILMGFRLFPLGWESILFLESHGFARNLSYLY